MSENEILAAEQVAENVEQTTEETASEEEVKTETNEQAETEKTEEPADAKMSINHFSALLCGTRDAQDMPWMPAVQILTPDADFSGVFYLKKNYMMDLF